MAEGVSYIRIGVPPRVVSGDRLASSRCGLTIRYLHCYRAHPMSRDWGCTSTSIICLMPSLCVCGPEGYSFTGYQVR